MLEDGVNNYISEISRVLKSGGRCYLTVFLLNADSIERINKRLGEWHFPYEEGSCRLLDKVYPDKGVAHDERQLKQHFSMYKMDVAEATYGNWCGRKVTLNTIQDSWILIKA